MGQSDGSQTKSLVVGRDEDRDLKAVGVAIARIKPQHPGRASAMKYDTRERIPPFETALNPRTMFFRGRCLRHVEIAPGLCQRLPPENEGRIIAPERPQSHKLSVARSGTRIDEEGGPPRAESIAEARRRERHVLSPIDMRRQIFEGARQGGRRNVGKRAHVVTDAQAIERSRNMALIFADDEQDGRNAETASFPRGGPPAGV